MKAVRTIDLVTARRLAIAKQRLSGAAPRSSPAKVLDVVRSIRCVQLDPISVVARSPLLVLRSRLAAFQPEHLDRVAYRDRKLFEYWAHAASLVLTEDYPIHHSLMRNYPGRGARADRTAAWVARNDKLRRSILSDLRRRGPLRTRDLADHSTEGWRSSGWTSDRNVDQMLDFLWTKGRVLVADRRGLQKWWDLAEQVLPAEIRARRLPHLEVTRRAAELSLRGLGVGTMAQIRSHFTPGRYPELPRVLEGFERSGLIERVEVMRDGDPLRRVWYVHRDDLALLERIEHGRWRPRTTLLSPFDNLIRDRKRALELLDLDYRIEIYVPKAKRRFGYYAMPLLDGDRILARVDPAADRHRGRLLVHAVTPEPGVRPDRSSAVALAGAVNELASWVGADAIEVTGSVPAVWRRSLG